MLIIEKSSYLEDFFSALQIWLDFFQIKPEEGLEDYFYTRNRKVNKAIVQKFKDSLYLNFIRYFSKESNLDLSEPEETIWRTP